jgi:hypothetical protein
VESVNFHVGWSGAAHSMASCGWVSHESARNSALLESGENLFTLLDVAPKVALAVDDEHRSFCSVEISNW